MSIDLFFCNQDRKEVCPGVHWDGLLEGRKLEENTTQSEKAPLQMETNLCMEKGRSPRFSEVTLACCLLS